MKRILIGLMIAAFALSSTACFNNQVITSADYDPAQEEPDYSHTHIHVLGLVDITGPIDLDEVCDTEAGIVENVTYLNGWVSSASVYCTPGGAELDQDESVAVIDESAK